jgi:hypothetical protein
MDIGLSNLDGPKCVSAVGFQVQLMSISNEVESNRIQASSVPKSMDC